MLKLAYILIVVSLLGIIYIQTLTISTLKTGLARKEIPVPTDTPPLNAYHVYSLVNNYRTDHGLKALVFDPSMCPFAEKRLNEIHSDFSHAGWYSGKSSAYGNYDLGENLDEGFSTDEENVDAWINSPEHLENIIKPIYTRTCVAVDEHYTVNYAVQEFASY